MSNDHLLDRGFIHNSRFEIIETTSQRKVSQLDKFVIGVEYD
jgi:hypothetical protein